MEVRTERPKQQRTRTAHFVLRLNAVERTILDDVAARLGMNASECMRYLIRRAGEERTTPTKKRRSREKDRRGGVRDRT